MQFIKNIKTLFLLLPLLAFPQGEANIWYFGYNAGLDFSSGSPVALTNGQLTTFEGCATLSDTAAAFYDKKQLNTVNF